MRCPPCFVFLRIPHEGRHIRLWLPLFLIFPLIAVFVLLLTPFILIAAIVLWPSGWGRSLLLAGPALFRVLCELRGLKVDVAQSSERMYISFQ